MKARRKMTDQEKEDRAWHKLYVELNKLFADMKANKERLASE